MSVTIYDQVIGKSARSVRRVRDGVVFDFDNGTTWYMYHPQDCCESVALEEVVGDLSDLEGSPLLMAEEVSSEEGRYEWTFYKFATNKGFVAFRWCGDMDSYYSISVYFEPFATPPYECRPEEV